MLKYKRSLGAFLLLVGLVFLAWASTSSRSYQECETYHHAKAAEHQEHIGASAIFFRCGGVFLEKHNGVITAIATVFLTWITWMLVVLSRQQTETTQKQLRAYLSVTVGKVIYQERAKNLKFEAKPVLANKGQTPAFKVRYNANAKVIPNDLLDDFSFAGIENPSKENMYDLSAGEERGLSAVVPSLIPDDQVEDTKTGEGKNLWAWGIVQYEDIFGREHTLCFCHRYFWLPNGDVYCIYDPRFGGRD